MQWDAELPAGVNHREPFGSHWTSGATSSLCQWRHWYHTFPSSKGAYSMEEIKCGPSRSWACPPRSPLSACSSAALCAAVAWGAVWGGGWLQRTPSVCWSLTEVGCQAVSYSSLFLSLKMPKSNQKDPSHWFIWKYLLLPVLKSMIYKKAI